MTGSVKVTSNEIKDALKKRYHYDSCGFYTEIDAGPDALGRSFRLDGVNLRVSGNSMLADVKGMFVQGFEIKVSRSDFLRDSKWNLYWDYVNTLTLVCPKGMVKPNEVPEKFGLMYYNPDSKTLRYKRQPSINENADSSSVKDSILVRLFYGMLNDGKFKDYGQKRYESAKEYIDEKNNKKDVGKMFGTKMAKRIDELEHKEVFHKYGNAYHDAFDGLANIALKHGIYLDVWEINDDSGPEDIDRFLESSSKAFDGLMGVDRYRQMLDNLEKFISDEMESIEGKKNNE